jgi:hypothetical protein
MHMTEQQTKGKKEGGYILLITVLLISIFLAIGLSVFTIGIKELILASFIRESRKAFAVADRAVECTLYWDRAYPANGFAYTIFPTSTDYISIESGSPMNKLINGVDTALLRTATCDGATLLHSDNHSQGWWQAQFTNSDPIFIVSYSIQFPSDNTCAEVVVEKNDLSTTVRANGYSNCNTSDPRRIQRTIEVTNNI